MTITPEYRAAYGETQDKIDRVQGLAAALSQLIWEHEIFQEPNPKNRAIRVVSEALVDAADELWPLHDAEWEVSRHDHAKETPVLELYRLWEKTKSQAQTATEQAEAIAPELDRLHGQMLATPSTCAADFVAKVALLSIYGECGLPRELDRPDLWAEARALIR